jgi:3-oxoacyl-(acyl-carrier-protein) synthase III
MPHKVRIALDAMGGDHGAAVVVPGAELSLSRHPGIEFLLFGDRAVVEPLLEARPRLKAAAQLVHTDVSVKMHDKPSQALRKGRWKSSMWLAIDAVRKGEADAAISAGNTGALMAMAKFNLRTMARIERPAIAALWPTLRGESIVLDLGASIGADSGHLVDLAAMGGAMARVVFGLERPTVGLLNIGVEEAKGLEEVREAGRILREGHWPQIEYVGFVEGDDIGKGTVDCGGDRRLLRKYCAQGAEAPPASSAIAQARDGPLAIRARLPDGPRRVPRAQPEDGSAQVRKAAFSSVLNGIVIKSHGGTDAKVSPVPSTSATTWCAANCSPRSAQPHAPQREAVSTPLPSGEPPRDHAAVGGLGCGSYLPRRVLPNSELSRMVDTSDEWITQRTGIRERHIAADGETTSDMALRAARAALGAAGADAQSIDLIVLATSTPDNTFPASAVAVQAGLGLTHGAAFDLQAVCSGFVFGLAVADGLLKTGAHKRALVIGSETFSRILDWTDRGTCVLFGDGAGAVVLEAQLLSGTRADRGILTTHLRSDGRHKLKLYVDGGPSSTQTVGHLRMEGRAVFKHAVAMITDVIEQGL